MKKSTVVEFILFCVIAFSANANQAVNCIQVEEVFLNEKVYNELKSKILNKDAVCFKNIPGGQANLLINYSRILRDKEVHVSGYCNSLCAQLALSAKSLSMNKSTDPKNPTYLFIHGIFNIETEAWHPSSLNDVDYYVERLKVIDKKYIEQALSFKKYGPSGLIISSTPFSQISPNKSLVNVCEDFPKKCHSLGVYDLKKIGIYVENDKN